MEVAATDGGACAEAVCFLRYFNDMDDPRQRGKVIYPLDEVLLLSLLAVLAGAETFADIARFGDRKLAFHIGDGPPLVTRCVVEDVARV